MAGAARRRGAEQRGIPTAAGIRPEPASVAAGRAAIRLRPASSASLEGPTPLRGRRPVVGGYGTGKWCEEIHDCWRTVNGFIALGPIPGCRGAASCRPPRSWHLGRRSGRVPALPYPPPRHQQCIGDHGHRAMPGLGQPLARRGRRPGWNCGPGSGDGSRTLATRRMVDAVCGWACRITE